MATINSNFIRVTQATLSGTAVKSDYLQADNAKEAATVEQGSGGTCVDRVTVDFSLTSAPVDGTPPKTPLNYGTYLGAYALNGATLLELSGTTPQSIDLTDLTGGTPTSYAGDTTFAKAYAIVVQNLGAGAVTLAPGASNPAGLPTFTGTTPTIQIAAGSVHVYGIKAGVTVDSTHKVLTFTPAATTTVAVSVGGA